MTALKLIFKNGEGDLEIKNGQLVVADDLNTLVLTSEFSDARAAQDDNIDPLQPQVFGFWGEQFMPINGRRWGSKYWQYKRSILNNNTVNGISDAGKECVKHLVDNGIVINIDVVTERQGSQRIAQQITYQEPDQQEKTRVTFNNLWDVIRGHT